MTTRPSDHKTKPLQDQVALITGAGRGIGRAIARAYAGAGAAIGCAARTVSEIEDTVAEIKQVGGQAISLPTDVTRREQVVRMVEQTVDTFGGLDILVVNAGGNFDRNAVEASDPADWQATLDLNLTGAYYCAQAVIPALKDRGGGKIIMIGSGLGHHGRANGAAYACSKAGLWMLTRVLAQELWSDQISVNELIPGPVNTELTTDSERDSNSVFTDSSEWIKGPDAVAPLALFLATQPAIGPTAQSYSLMRRAT